MLATDDTAPHPADAPWWAKLAALAAERGTVILEEGYVLNASRRHQVTAATVDTVQARLTPRARFWVWPDDLSPDVDTVLAGLSPDGLVDLVWQGPDGRLSSRLVDHAASPELRALLAGARAAMAISGLVDERRPLLTGVLPDPDGVLRARWIAD